MTVQSPIGAGRSRASRFDPLDPAFLDDPYPTYERLRNDGPIVRDGATQWVAARHETVARLLREPRLRSQWPEPFQQMRIGPGPGSDFLVNVVLHRDGPDHALLRRLLNATMRATTGDEITAVVTQVTDAALERAFATGRLEVMADLARPVPVAAACEMIGVPAVDRPLVEAWGLTIIKAFTVMLPEEDRPAVAEAVTRMREYLQDRLDGATEQHKLGRIYAVLAADGGGPFSRTQLIDNLIFLLVSGFTTTVHLVAGIGGALLTRPEVYADLRSEPALVPGAIEEFLRWDTPIQHVSRFAAEPVEVAGTTIRTGRIVHLLLGSANRDPLRFERPEELDIRRSPNPHVSFGAGVHMCLGAGLGRLEATALLRQILLRCATFELDGTPERLPVQVFRTWGRLPARVRPA